MKDQEINLIVEPSFYLTHWYRDTMKGVDHEVTRRNLELKIRVLDDFKNENILKYYRKRRLIVILGTSVAWIEKTIVSLSSLGLHPLLIYSQFPDNYYPYSYITLNHMGASSDITAYFLNAGRKRIAFFGMNPASLSDILKFRGFKNTLSASGIHFVNDDLYANKGFIKETMEAFAKKYTDYDSILCVNDIVALLLMQYLRTELKIKLDDYYIAGFGDSLVGRVASPSLTTVALDYFEAGRKAVDLYTLLIKRPNIISSSLTISSTIKVRESTGYHKLDLARERVRHKENMERVDFYGDEKIKEVFSIESLLQKCDDLDGSIIDSLLNNLTYEQMVEKLNITMTPLKYRINKMVEAAGLKSKEELLLLILKYLGKNVGDRIASLRKD